MPNREEGSWPDEFHGKYRTGSAQPSVPGRTPSGAGISQTRLRSRSRAQAGPGSRRVFPRVSTRAKAVWLLAWRLQKHNPRLVPRQTRGANPKLPMRVRAAYGNRPHSLFAGILSPMPQVGPSQAGARRGDLATSQGLPRPTSGVDNCGWPLRTPHVPGDSYGPFNHSDGAYKARLRP